LNPNCSSRRTFHHQTARYRIAAARQSGSRLNNADHHGRAPAPHPAQNRRCNADRE
jgi:hypothetical protein